MFFTLFRLFLTALLLTACGGGGSSSEPSQDDTIEASFTYTSTYEDIVKYESVSFQAVVDSQDGNVTYLWNFGDGESSNEQNPVHTYTSASTPTVVLKISSGSISTSVSKTLLINEGRFSDTLKSSFSDTIDTYFNAKAQRAGLSAAIYKDGYPVFSHAIGKSTESKTMTTSTPVMLYSITKTVTASMIMQLIQNETLNLNDTLSQAMGSRANALNDSKINKNATIEQLLNHTSGIQDYVNADSYSFIASLVMGSTWKPEDVLALINDDVQNIGTHYYSNSNFILLGMIIEEKTGEKLNEYFKDIASSLGIDSAALLPQDALNANIAEPYDDLATQGGTSGEFGNLLETQPYFFTGAGALMWSAGGMSMTAIDLAKYMYAYIGNNGTLINSNTRSTVLDSVTSTSNNYGYGITIEEDSSNSESPNIYGHGGGGAGYIAKFSYDPVNDIVFVILSNSANTTGSTSIDALDGNDLFYIIKLLRKTYSDNMN
jgi:CubicO group peptidase (beta-lactamase class C family)